MKEVQKEHKRLLDNLRVLQKVYSAKALSSIIGVSQNTWTNRMREPWRSFSYDDFRAISKFCKVDMSTLLEGSVNVG